MNENNAKKRRFKVTVDGNDYIVDVEELPTEDVDVTNIASRDTAADDTQNNVTMISADINKLG